MAAPAALALEAEQHRDPPPDYGRSGRTNPLTIWLVTETAARLDDEDFGTPGRLPEQARLGDFWIPQRGVFAMGRAFFTPG